MLHMRKLFFCVFLLSFCALPSLAQRSDTLLEKWEFMRGGSSVWEEVTVPPGRGDAAALR